MRIEDPLYHRLELLPDIFCLPAPKPAHIDEEYIGSSSSSSSSSPSPASTPTDFSPDGRREGGQDDDDDEKLFGPEDYIPFTPGERGNIVLEELLFMPNNQT